MPIPVYVDGQDGTTGLQIHERLARRTDITCLRIPEHQRKDVAARRAYLNEATLVFLCLPDGAAREAVSLIDNPRTRVIDASTAHRTAPGWVYGFPELSPSHRQAVAGAMRVANPGCHATGFISLVYPLIAAGLLPREARLACHSLTGYTGGGRAMIAQYENPARDSALQAPRVYGLTLSHKHLPEMQAVCGLAHAPLFDPIVADFPRGMLVCVPVFAEQVGGAGAQTLRDCLAAHYEGSRLISVLPYVPGETPEGGFMNPDTLAGTNRLEIRVLGHDTQALLVARLDNLGKGASGAAVQCMNLMLGADECEGL